MENTSPRDLEPGLGGDARAAGADSLAREREKLDVARDDVRAGRTLSGAALDAWLKAWADGKPVEVPLRRTD